MADEIENSGAESVLKTKTFTYDDLRELRNESAGYRKKAKAHETEIETLRASLEAAKSEINTTKESLTAVEKAAQDRLIRAELKAHAVKAGMIDLDGLKLLDLSGLKLTDTGDVEGAEAIFAKAKETKPYLFGSNTSTTSTAKPPEQQPAVTKHARDMTAAEFAAAEAAYLAKSRR